LVEDNFDDLNDQAADDIGSSSGVKISSFLFIKIHTLCCVLLFV
jgi:hypothetical protein